MKYGLMSVEYRRSQKGLNMTRAIGHMPSRPKNHSLSGKGMNSIFLGKHNRGSSSLNTATK